MTGRVPNRPGLMARLRRLDAALTPGKGKPSGKTTLSGDPVSWPARFRRKLAFGATVRADVWQLIADVVAAGISIDVTVETLIEGYLRSGRKGRALVLAEMRAGLLAGNAGARLVPYVSPAERLPLGGLGSQEAEVVFDSTARLLRNRLALRKAMSGAMAMPLLLIAGLVGIFMFFGLELLPALSEVIDLETIGGWQGWIVGGTLAFSANPERVALVLGGLVAGILVSMRIWTGPGRAFADRLPPWSLMRLQAGTGFLFAVIEAGRTGTAVTPALLERMAKATGRYEASRIRALIPGLERTGNLGTAALEAGQGFPGDDIALVLRVLWNREDGIEKAGGFLERRLERIESVVRARMAVLNALLLAAVAGALVAMMFVTLPIVDGIMTSVGGI